MLFIVEMTVNLPVDMPADEVDNWIVRDTCCRAADDLAPQNAAQAAKLRHATTH